MMLTIAIVLFICCFISYGAGMYFGIKEGEQEANKTAARVTKKQIRKIMFENGSLFSRN